MGRAKIGYRLGTEEGSGHGEESMKPLGALCCLSQLGDHNQEGIPACLLAS